VSGYAATARIHGATPRLVQPARDDWTAATVAPRPGAIDVAVVVPGAGDRLATPTTTLGERWTSIRERWSQLTFYLLDAESWR
jgi:hypothetical protein